MTEGPGRIYEVAQRQRAALLRGERQAAGELVRAYGQVWRRIKVSLDALLDERRRAEAAGAEITAGWLYQYGRLQSLQSQVTGEIRQFAEFADSLIIRQQGAAVEAALAHTEELVRMQEAGVRSQESGGGPSTVLRPAQDGGSGGGIEGVEIRWERLPREAVQSLIGFTADGSPLRALLDALGPAASAAVRDELISGVALGIHPTQIARRVKESLGGNLVRALRISRTETLRAYREATFLSYQANDQVVDGWVWLSAATARTCAACWGLHGSVHPLSERQVDHPNGRCSAIPHLRPSTAAPDDGASAQDAQPIAVESGEAQFARMEPSAQDAIIGQAAGAAYRAGAVKLADFVGRRQDPGWGAALGVRSLRGVVGVDRSAGFSSWARALSQGDAAIVRTAEQLAQRRGVLAAYNGDAQVAQLMTDGVLGIPRDAWLPRQISVDAEWFTGAERQMRVASFDPKRDALLINPHQDYWRLSDPDRKTYLAQLARTGVLATAERLHPVLHELAHVAQRKAGVGRLPAAFSAAERAIAEGVSLRAAWQPVEFLAEVLAGELLGRTFAPAVKSLYKAYGGLQR